MGPGAARPQFPRGCLRIGPAGSVLIRQAGAGRLAARDASKGPGTRDAWQALEGPWKAWQPGGRAAGHAAGQEGQEGPAEGREKQASSAGGHMQNSMDSTAGPWKASKTARRRAIA